MYSNFHSELLCDRITILIPNSPAFAPEAIEPTSLVWPGKSKDTA
jgi:hypothetical protein